MGSFEVDSFEVNGINRTEFGSELSIIARNDLPTYRRLMKWFDEVSLALAATRSLRVSLTDLINENVNLDAELEAAEAEIRRLRKKQASNEEGAGD